MLGKKKKMTRVLLASSVAKLLYRELCILSRVHPIPGGLPAKEDFKGIGNLATALLRDQKYEEYWDSAPEFFPISEDEVSEMEAFARARQLEEYPDIDRIRAHGLFAYEIMENMEFFLLSYSEGVIPWPSQSES